MLEIDKISTFYGSSQILFELSLEVNSGEIVALLGRNGAGKTTTLRSIMGLTPPKSGSVRYKGKEIAGIPPYKIAKLGIGFVPEDRVIFPDLTVLDNFMVGAKKGAGQNEQWTTERLFDLFPVLKARADQKGGTLSGGEQQMLTIARTLMGNPDLLLVDEPTEGLAPLLVRNVRELITAIAEAGATILLSEQNIKFALKSARDIYVIEKGKIQYRGTTEHLQENQDIIKKYLVL